ncbi:hypothetical protein M3Y99_00823500 [Aphelenchoides fujianensis]|nr:hypothetical protein M3Y99_00823500 [Aphelenchoides fujianensis]
METAVVKRKPRIRAAAVRDGLNRYLMAAALAAKKKKHGVIQLIRLASLSRAQLASVRRSVPAISFTLQFNGWQWSLPEFRREVAPERVAVRPKEMSALVKLLRVPVRLLFVDTTEFKNVDWWELKNVEEFVNELNLSMDPSKFPALWKFVHKVKSQLRELECSADVLDRLPPLDLDKFHAPDNNVNYEALSRHTIRRLDVPGSMVSLELPDDHVLSPTIKSLGLTQYMKQLDERPESIVAFCRRFPALEDLHLNVHYQEEFRNVEDPFKRLWSGLLRFRDRLTVLGLKRLFLKVQYTGTTCRYTPGWLDRLKRMEPFDQASFLTAGLRIRVFLKLNWPTEKLPTFFRIEGEFWDEEQEKDEYDSDDFYCGYDDEMDGRDESEDSDEDMDEREEREKDASKSSDESMDADDRQRNESNCEEYELSDFEDYAMDADDYFEEEPTGEGEDEATDEDGMDDAGVL